MSSPDKLVTMANQIGKFFASQGEEAEVPGIAAHIRKFWDPRMRKAIVDFVEKGGEGLQPCVKKAVLSLRAIAPAGSS